MRQPYVKLESCSIREMRRALRFSVQRCSHDELEFDVLGVDCMWVNVLRRLLLAEVPSVAPEKVLLYQNTSLIQDEILAHRLGLLPLAVDPRLLTPLGVGREGTNCPDTEDLEQLDASAVLVFDLKARCQRNPKFASAAPGAEDAYLGRHVYSRQLQWVPLPGQAQLFASAPPRPVHSDILLAKLGPGQELEARLYCVRGRGRDHAKFSPVATAFYRLHPEVRLLRPVAGEAARRLAGCFPAGVLRLDEAGCAQVADQRPDVGSREWMRHEDLKDTVQVALRPDHFIFQVESTGALSAAQLVREAFKLLIVKCDVFLNALPK